MPEWITGADVCWFSFPITCRDDRGKLVKYLESKGLETRSMFSGNITKHPAYKDSKFKISGDLKEANYILEHSFWITCHPRSCCRNMNARRLLVDRAVPKELCFGCLRYYPPLLSLRQVYDKSSHRLVKATARRCSRSLKTLAATFQDAPQSRQGG